MKILSVPNPILKKKSTPIEVFDKKMAKFVKDLEKTLVNKKNPEGVGLSAPQVGKNWRLFSIIPDHSHKQSIRTLLNPEVVDLSEELVLGENSKRPTLEGCLSIPLIYGPIWRHKAIKLSFVEYVNGEPNTKTETFSDYIARVVQHEYDHLDGVLFTDRAMEQDLPLYKEMDGDLVEIKLTE